jgi:hypothetical protein
VNEYTPYIKPYNDKGGVERKAEQAKSTKYIHNEICNVKISDIKDLDEALESSTYKRSRAS